MAGIKRIIIVPDGPYCDGCSWIVGHHVSGGESYYTCGQFLDDLNYKTGEGWHLRKCGECSFYSDEDSYKSIKLKIAQCEWDIERLTKALDYSNIRLEELRRTIQDASE